MSLKPRAYTLSVAKVITRIHPGGNTESRCSRRPNSSQKAKVGGGGGGEGVIFYNSEPLSSLFSLLNVLPERC